MRSVLIEGGGIAGQVLKKELSLRGVSSRLAERAAFPRDKVCGGVLQWDTWEYLRERFSLGTPARSFQSIAHVWRRKRIARHRLPAPMVYVPRIELDHALASAQKKEDAAAGSLCVNARGAEAKGEWLGFQAECAPAEELEMHYGRGVCAGVAPTLGGRAHLALVVRRGRFHDAGSLRAYLRSELGLEALGPFKGTPAIHYGYHAGLAVGDAKMTTFPFLGLGMKHAVRSSCLLAGMIADGRESGYAAEHRRRFWRQRVAAGLVLRLYDSPFQAALLPWLKNERLFLGLYRWLHAC